MGEGSGLVGRARGPSPWGASISARIHYKKTWLDEGKEIRDRIALAHYFSTGKTKPTESLAVEARDGEGAYTLPRDIEFLSLLPKVESLLESLLAEAILPDRKSLPLIRLREPDPGWPRTYRLRKPISLPKGTRLRLPRPHLRSLLCEPRTAWC